jgi:small-conductance mechanosensitive channel
LLASLVFMPAPLPADQGNETEDLDKRLNEVTTAMEALSTAATLASGAPPGTPEQELLARRARLATLAGLYRLRMARAGDLADIKAQRARLDQDLSQWLPPLVGPPFSYLAVDQLQERAQSLQFDLKTDDAELEALQHQYNVTQERWNSAQQSLRQLTEALGNQQNPAEQDALRWQKDQAELQGRVIGTSLALLEDQRRLTQERRAYDQDRFSRIQQALVIPVEQVEFPREELDRILGEIATQLERLDQEAEAATAASIASRAALQVAVENLKVGENADQAGVASATDFSARQQAADLARARYDNAEGRLRLVLLRQQGLRRMSDIWGDRWSLANAGNATAQALRDAQAALAQGQEVATALRRFLDMRLVQARNQLGYQDLMVGTDGASDASRRDPALVEAYQERTWLLDQALQVIGVFENLLGRWETEIGHRLRQRSYWARTGDLLSAMGIWLQAGWTYELLAVEDSIQVDGETITGKRSITVGKVIRAIAILVFGFWLSRWLSYRVEALAVARFGLDPNRARIARRWTETLGLFALVIFALIWVQIPLTVFAFLGGAIAIGLGFGMQNALKNLISGLMILFERPFRPGDLIEVGAIRGRVTEIGVRSSVVRNSQGIETLIPNSTLVEQNLTNWTYSTPVVRFEIRIGVAYGSPSRRIAEILVAVAQGHPSVLASPEPRVVFEDFGADALMFSLDFWVEVKPGVEARVVASDLRHLIGEALAEAGITIAFPQRDIHLDAARPLSVQLVKASV